MKNPAYNLFTSILLIIAFSIGIISCSSEFNPDIQEEDMLVINVFAEGDSLVWASVSHSWVYNSGDNWNSVIVDNARVECSFDGGEWIPMKYEAEGKHYVSPRRAAAGERITVRAHSDIYGDAEGSTEVPVAVPVDSWTYSLEIREDTNSFIYVSGDTFVHPTLVRVHYKITFTDPADRENYYMVSMKEMATWELEDPIISENESNIDGVFSKYHYTNFFSDRSIQGKTYSLSLYTDHYTNLGYFPNDDFIDSIKFYSISRDYYLYLLSLSRKYNGLQGNLEELGMADPRTVYTNVYPGIGIVAGCSSVLVEHDITEIMENASH